LQTTTTNASTRLAGLLRSISAVVKGKEDVIQLALTTLLARGHLLIEDVPGVGKTTLARRWPARSIAPSNASSSLRTCCPAM